MFGLLGYPLGHSFSKGWYEAQGYTFQNFEYPDVAEFWANIPSELQGFCVTIPHKEAVIPFLDSIDSAAKEIGAVNCVVVSSKDGSKKGYNTDVIGFWDSLSPLLNPTKLKAGGLKAAILGYGGAAKGVDWILRDNGIETSIISRKNGGYNNFEPQNYDIIVNTTPLGMYPKVESYPPIEYHNIRVNTICYDLVYNPSDTEFLKRCRREGAVVIGGIKMLHLQAEAALRLFSAR